MKETGYEKYTDRELVMTIPVLEARKSKLDKQIMLMKREIKRRKNENKSNQTRYSNSSLCQEG